MWGERYCKAVLGEVVRPDGLGVWREAGASVTFCLEYDRGSEPLGRLAGKASDYSRLEAAWGVSFWVLVVVPGPRHERGARAALSGEGLAVATTTPDGALRPTGAVWAPHDGDDTRLRLIDLATWPRSAASAARLAGSALQRRAGATFVGQRQGGGPGTVDSVEETAGHRHTEGVTIIGDRVTVTATGLGSGNGRPRPKR